MTVDAGLPISVAKVFVGLEAIEHELLLFAAFWFIIGAIDELAIDLSWLWLRLTGRLQVPRLKAADETLPLVRRTAVFVPTWSEASVIGQMIAHMLRAWPQDGYTLYVGCYRNDNQTVEVVLKAAGHDPRVRLVVHDRDGPTTKADCLNRLYAAMAQDERRRGWNFESVVFHDAEDMVHPAALSQIDAALGRADFVQLPVRPEPQAASRWISGHYADEFAEAHAKTLVVRSALGAAIPAAGVGCGFARETFARLERERQALGHCGPFADECLTEDYELGLIVSGSGGRGEFLRVRDRFGELVATRAYFPAMLSDAVRQKTRWLHGIAFQGWDRLGWRGGAIDIWMSLRDRRGPLTAIVLTVAYALLLVEAILIAGQLGGWERSVDASPMLRLMVSFSFAAFVWRAVWRFGFTASEYGIAEGLLAVARIPVSNVIAIMSGRRALAAYVRSLRGNRVAWDKTAHALLPSGPPRSPRRGLAT